MVIVGSQSDVTVGNLYGIPEPEGRNGAFSTCLSI